MPEDQMHLIANAVSKGKIGHEFVYCIEEDKFYTYSKGIWKPLFWMEILNLISSNDKYYNDMSSVSINRKKQVLEHLKLMVYKRLDVFNSKGYLNFTCGEFDPITGIVHPHDKENYSTFMMEYDYDPDATCPTWEKTLDEILESDEEKISILQEFFGHCLVPDNTQKKALLLLGESNCGKSTILFMLRDMMGEQNISSVPLKELSNSQFTPQLINKLVNIDTDVCKNAQDYEAEFKKITSAEPIQCNQKFIKSFDFIPKCRMVMAANIFPKITDHSSAFYNRLILIPCDRIFTEDEQDKNLRVKLKKELPGILNWACVGLRRLQERGKFEEHNFMRDAVKELENENNPVNLFFEDHVEIEIDSYVEKKELFDRYKEWSIDSKNYTLSKARFAQCVFKHFHKITAKDTRLNNNGPRIWKNIKYVPFKDEVKPQEILWEEK